MQYSKSLKLTAATAWDTWYNASAIACTCTATAWNWYLGAFFSPQALKRYDAIGKVVGVLAVVAVALGMTARIYLTAWCDRQVEAATVPASSLQSHPPAQIESSTPDGPEPQQHPVGQTDRPRKETRRSASPRRQRKSSKPRSPVGQA